MNSRFQWSIERFVGGGRRVSRLYFQAQPRLARLSGLALTGARLQAFMADASRPRVRGVVEIRAERCKGCGFCVEFCPTDVLALSSGFTSKGYHPPEVVRPEACSGCDLCGMYCPDFAIFGHKL